MAVLPLIALLVLVLVNGFFVAAEFALVRSRRSRLETLVNEGDRLSARTLEQIDRMDEYLSACQLGITMASIGIGFLGEPALARLFEPALGNVVSHGVAVSVAFAIAFVISTSLHITVGEQVPKMMAISRAESTARRIGRGLDLFRIAAAPFIWVLNAISNFVVRRLGVSQSELEETHSSEDLRLMIASSATGGHLDPGEAHMLGGVFHLHEQEARQVMTPIPAVVTVDAAESAEAALRRCISSGHTRLVAIEDDNPDRVKGLVHSNSIARLLMSDGPEALVEPLVREAPIVPETKALDDLLAELQRQRMSMAIVIDEYGRTVGIVTVEDILEEVVGEIEDETDPRAASMRQLVGGDWFVRGHVSLADLQDAGVDLPVDSEAFNSVGGYVFAELGRLPKRGDAIAAGEYAIRVESVRENRIEAVRISDVAGSAASSS